MKTNLYQQQIDRINNLTEVIRTQKEIVDSVVNYLIQNKLHEEHEPVGDTVIRLLTAGAQYEDELSEIRDLTDYACGFFGLDQNKSKTEIIKELINVAKTSKSDFDTRKAILKLEDRVAAVETCCGID